MWLDTGELERRRILVEEQVPSLLENAGA